MAFDLISFLVGVGAGLVTGGLAGILHGLERTANIQEKFRIVSKEVERMTRTWDRKSESGKDAKPAEVDRLQRELDEIQEEIRQMYKRSAR